MNITQRGVLPPVDGADWSYGAVADELGGNLELTSVVQQVSSVDLGTLNLNQILFIEASLLAQDQGGLAPIGVNMLFNQTGSAVIQLIRGGSNRENKFGTCPLNGQIQLNTTAIARVTTAGTKTINITGSLSGGGVTGIFALALFTGLAVLVV